MFPAYEHCEAQADIIALKSNHPFRISCTLEKISIKQSLMTTKMKIVLPEFSKILKKTINNQSCPTAEVSTCHNSGVIGRIFCIF